ncbi:type I polyketide synthase [Rhodovarius crocodyli]|nr:type I polyketide synthase [Rhodovarius crocodyli]
MTSGSPPGGPRAPLPADAVAVVGLACRLPGAPDAQAFWQLLAEGRDAVTTVPADRFSIPFWHHPRRGEPGRGYTFAAGTLGEVHDFDAAAFGLSPREAAESDPQQRLILELVREAFEDAGWPEASVAGQDLGVYIGASTTDHSDLRQFDAASADRYMMTGAALSIIANRVTNIFDLHGPAMTIDTACSSALVALHHAAEALAAGNIPAAVVGGVNMLLSPFPFGGFARASMLSPTGRCHAFDSRADGYVRAEGGVVVVLKRLDRALADGDTVHGVILASNVNAAGRTIGLSLPNQKAQSALISSLLDRSGVDPARIRYYEAHGTGTAAGDPIEAHAIAAALSARRAGEKPLLIGSAKTNIGHTEAASGLVGLAKALLILRHGQVPPSINFEKPNPHIDFRGLNMKVAARRPQPLPGREDAVLGVNSFGFGGTNAGVLVTRGPEAAKRAPAAARRGLPPLLLSARSEGALRGLAGLWAQRLDGASAPEAAGLIRAQLRHRDWLPQRLALRAATPAELSERLAGFAAQQTVPDIAQGSAPRGRGVAFVFSGNGAQWAGMAQAAMLRNAAFRAAVKEADRHLKPLLGWSVARAMAQGVDDAMVAATDHAQPLLFAAQVGIVAALAEQGIEPSLVMGHSVGEVAAAWASGMLTLPAACKLIVARSHHQHMTRGQGRMAALGAGAEQAAPVLDACSLPGEAPLEIAAINAPGAITVAGPPAALARLDAAAREHRWSYIPLGLDYAFHSSTMDPVRAGLLKDLRGLKGRKARLPFISTVTGELLAPEECTPAYWWRNLREPVRFSAALGQALDSQPALFLEIGPNPVLQSYLREGLRNAGSEAGFGVTLSKRDVAGDPFPQIADRATVQGADPRAAAHFDGPALRRGLPAAPLERVPTPVPRTAERLRYTDPRRDHRLLGFRQGADAREWIRHLDLTVEPWLADHKLAGDPVFPAAGMLEMALAAGAARHPDAPALEVSEFIIMRALPLEKDRLRELRSRLDDEGQFTLESRRRLSDEPWSLHARGRVAEVPRLPSAPEPLPAEASRVITTEHLVAAASYAGLDYGPAFRPVARLAIEAAERHARAEFDLPPEAPDDEPFLLHPVRLDGAMQGMIGLLEDGGIEAGHGFVPVRMTRLVVRRGTPAASADIRLTVRGERSASADLVLRDAARQPVAVLEGCWVQKLRLPHRADPGQDIFHLRMMPALPAASPLAETAPALDITSVFDTLAAEDEAAEQTETALLLEGYVAAAEDESGELPPRADIWRQVLLEQPALAHELAWLAAAAEGVGAWPSPESASFETLAGLLAEGASRLAQEWPAGRPLRVLEVGAGPGPLTRRLGAALAATGRRVILHAAALPEGRPPQAPGEGVEFATSVWNPLGQEAAPLQADLVVGMLPSLRLHDAPGLLVALRQAVAPGGALLLAEALPGALWDFTLGRDSGWASPPGEDGWTEMLAEAGWQAAQVRRCVSSVLPAVLLAGHAAPALAARPPLPARRFMLLADAGAMPARAALAQAMQSRGIELLAGPAELGRAADIAPRAMQGAHLVVMLDPSLPDLAAALTATAHLAAAAQGSAAAMRLVTLGAEDGPATAAALAMARVLSNEMPSLKLRRIDMARDLPEGSGPRRLLAELLAENEPEAEVTLAQAGRLVPRLAQGLPPAPPAPGPRMLAVAHPGQLSSLHWVPMPEAPEPGPETVLVRVEAAGLNFRDVMWAQGLLPEETLLPGFAGPGLGIEMSGVVTAVPPGSPWKVGDAVFGFAPRAIAGRVQTRADALVRRPAHLPPAAAATVPVAFMTAVYALEEMARIEPDEVVLIHGGAGAVGLAALQVALNAGARVVATAGSPAKRAFLREAGAELVLDSRDPGFADALRAAGIAGVDIALNSLAGEAMERTLSLMKPFGRFIELGKRDYAENRRVALRPMRRNVSYFAVDVDELPRARPAVAARLLAGIAERLETGAFQPLPFAVKPAEEADAAFRALQASSHIGKLVIMPPPEAEGRAAVAWQPAGGVAVVVGGMQGFGHAAARWLRSQGAPRLALLSRRGEATPGAADALAALGEGARAFAVDATDGIALAATLAAIRAEMGPITTVVHAAAVFDDGTAAALDAARVARVMEAKLLVAEQLDALTAEDPVGLFLMFGSATVPVGSPGQAAYVAANAGLEALARRRQAMGRAALTVGWGPVLDTGVLAADATTAAGLARRLGAVALPAAQYLAALPAILDSGLPVAGVARIQWRQASGLLPVLKEPVFEAVIGGLPAEAEGEGADLADRVRGLPEAEALPVLRDAVRGELGRILRMPASSIAADAPLPGLGLDSLGGMELRTALERRMGMAVALSAVTEDLTADMLARRMLEALSKNPDEHALESRIAAYEPTAAANSEAPAKDAAE